MVSPSDRPLPDQVGRYQVVRLLGQGAMGRVLLAHDPILDRDVAIKLLRDDLRIPAEQRSSLFDRMRHEARASARVSHPNIVALHDMGEDPDLGLYLVFEHVLGTTLKDRLQRGALARLEVAELARQLGGALSTAHDAGVLHRDIKPENVMLTTTGAKIADFGIARVPDSTLTRDGGLLGTPAYSSPESIACGEFSPASDQFSLAATLWEAITGRRAFPGDDAVAVASKIALEEPPSLAETLGLSPEIDRILAQALAKNPRARFGGCEDFGHALADALNVTPRTKLSTLPDEYHREELTREARAHAIRNALGGVAVGVLLAIAGFHLTAGFRAKAASIRAESSAASATPRPSTPVGYLAERPPPKPRRPAARSTALPAAEADAGFPADAGQDTSKQPPPEASAQAPLGSVSADPPNSVL
jgi:serine/threonine protein kinase